MFSLIKNKMKPLIFFLIVFKIIICQNDERDPFSSLILFLKTTQSSINKNRIKYNKLTLPSMESNKLEQNLFIKNFKLDQLKQIVHENKSKLMNTLNDNLETLKIISSPIEERLIDNDTKQMLLNNKIDSKTKENLQITEDLNRVNSKKESILQENSVSQNYYKNYVEDLNNNLKNLTESLNIKTLNTDLSKDDKNFEQIKDTTELTRKAYSIVQKIFLYLNDQKNLHDQKKNEGGKSKYEILKKKLSLNSEDKLTSVLKNIDKLSHQTNSTSLNVLLEAINSEISPLDSKFIKEIYSTESEFNSVEEYIFNKKEILKKTSDQILENIANNSKKMQMSKEKREVLEKKLHSLKVNTNSLKKISLQYKKILNQERENTISLQNKLSTLEKNIEQRSKEKISTDKIVKPIFEKLKSEVKKNSVNQKQLENSKNSLIKVNNLINDMIIQENLILKVNKLNKN